MLAFANVISKKLGVVARLICEMQKTDSTGDCGMKPIDQWRIRQALKAQFPGKAWMDVFSKSDLLQETFAEADCRGLQQARSLVSPSSSELNKTEVLIRSLWYCSLMLIYTCTMQVGYADCR